VAGPQGEIIHESPVTEEDAAIVEIDIQRSETVRRWWPFLRDRRIDEYSDLNKRFLD
jgi:N-carbamoylputrescine amidase